MPYHLLLVEGDEQLGAGLAQFLRGEFEVDLCRLAHEALDHLKSKRRDLLLLDLDVPDMDGLTFLRVLRETEAGRDLPVIVLSPRKTEDSVARTFSLGAEDYLVKPADPRELAARIRTVLRRRWERSEHWGSPLSIGGIEIDPSQRRTLVQGKHVTLQPREFELLEILMRKAGRVLTRAYLLETVWGMSSTADTRAVDVMVSRLRRRLGGRGKKLIETISKMGYCFRNPLE
ncbi:MAG: response regulator transcription factor [Elusimicrobia bacterium]|nr:response regulator transcription factor [Elusimicrobiota bacterium]